MESQMTLKKAATTMATIVAVLWGIELVDHVVRHWFDRFGVHPRTTQGLLEIFSAPVLHHGWTHLIGNTIPLFVLGLLVLMAGAQTFAAVTLVSVLGSGLLVWAFAASNSVTLGASGVVFGYFAYILVRAFYTRQLSHMAIAIVVAVAYGSMLFGLLPLRAGVSWLAHLGGALGGVASAPLLQPRGQA